MLAYPLDVELYLHTLFPGEYQRNVLFSKDDKMLSFASVLNTVDGSRLIKKNCVLTNHLTIEFVLTNYGKHALN